MGSSRNGIAAERHPELFLAVFNDPILERFEIDKAQDDRNLRKISFESNIKLLLITSPWWANYRIPAR